MRKAGGKSGVLPELVLYSGVDLWDSDAEGVERRLSNKRLAGRIGGSNPKVR